MAARGTVKNGPRNDIVVEDTGIRCDGVEFRWTRDAVNRRGLWMVVKDSLRKRRRKVRVIYTRRRVSRVDIVDGVTGLTEAGL